MRNNRKRLRRIALFLSSFVIAPGLCLAKPQPQPLPPQNPAGKADDLFQQALLALRENHVEAALDALTRAEREHPQDPRIRNFRGVVLARLDRGPEAAAEYRDAIRLAPSMGDAYRNLGFLQWTEHVLEDARKSLEQALALKPDDSFAHFYLGRVQLDARQYEQAFLELRKSGLELPADATFVLAAATGYAAIDCPDDARAILSRLDLHYLSPSESLQASSLFASLGQADTAVGLLRSLDIPAARSNAADPPLWLRFDIAIVSLTAGDNIAAIRQVTPLTQAPDGPSPSGLGSSLQQSALAWSLLGIAHARQHEAEAAIKALNHAAELAPGKEEHWLNLTRELMELGRYTDAITATHEAITAVPQSYALQLRLGAAELAAGRYGEAEAVFRELITAGDPLPTSYVGLAQVLLRTDRADQASTELAAAHQRLGPTFLISYFQGLSLNRVNRRIEAAAAFREAIRLNPQSAEAHFGLGKTDLALGHIPEATADLEEAHRLSPRDLPTRRLLTQARSRIAGPMSKTHNAPAETLTETTTDPEVTPPGDFLLPDWQLPPTSSPQKPELSPVLQPGGLR